MKGLKTCLQHYKDKLIEIDAYIDFVDSQKEALNESEKKTQDEKIKILLSNMKLIYNTSLQYNSIIISIYGAFECFIDELFDEYIGILEENYSLYSELPKKLKEKHISRLGEYLSNPQRYLGYELTTDSAIENYYNACKKTPISFSRNKAFLMAHQGNLKIEQVASLMNDFGIEDSKNTMINHFLLKEYFSKYEGKQESDYEILKRRGSKELFLHLDELVDARNAVAHGSVDTRISNELIKSIYIPYIEYLGTIVFEILRNNVLKIYFDKGKVVQMGTPINIYNHSILCINNQELKLSVGDYVIAKNETEMKYLEIISLQKNKVPVSLIDEKNLDVGIGFIKRPGNHISTDDIFYLYHMN